MAGTQSGGDSPAREQLSALRSLLVLAMLLTQQDSQATILKAEIRWAGADVESDRDQVHTARP